MAPAELHVVIPVCKSRMDDLRECLDALEAPRDSVRIVFNGPDAAEESAKFSQESDQAVTFILGERNISQWWNLGINITRAAWPTADIAILNSDCRVHWSELLRMQEIMNLNDVSAVGPGINVAPGQTPVIKGAGPINLAFRLPGWCFILSGSDEQPIRANEAYRWWLSDDAIEQYARARRGVMLVGGVAVSHPPNGSPLDAEQDRWYGEDMRKFVNEFGFHPHGL